MGARKSSSWRRQRQEKGAQEKRTNGRRPKEALGHDEGALGCSQESTEEEIGPAKLIASLSFAGGPRPSLNYVRLARRSLVATIFLLGSVLLGGGYLFGETAKQQLNDIVRDTQKQGNRAGRVTIVWWMLPEFWRAAMSASGTVPVDKIDEMIKSISDINILAVIDAKIGGFGGADYAPAETLKKNLSVFDGQGKALAMIPDEKQSSSTKNMLAIMKPVMGNMLGEFGKNVTFFVFEGKNQDGSRRVDPAKPGSFLVKLNVEEFRWRLPLGSLLPQKICPKCKEAFPGNYNYCPFDATALVVEKSDENR